jgi:hypothetical protein
VVDTSECQILLAQAFEIVFREFELFLDISKEFNGLVTEPSLVLKNQSEAHEVLIKLINKRKYD